MDPTNIYPFKLVRAPLFVWLMVAAVGLVCFSFLMTLGVTRLLLAIGKIGSEIVNLLLLVSRATKVVWTYKSHTTLQSCTLPHVCVMCVVCMG